jgi:polar amino acid transport system substrate-binding protein
MHARLTAVAAIFALLCALSGPASARKLVFAVDPTYPPLEMVDDDQNIIGFTADLVAAIGGAAGFTYEFKHVPWENIFTGLTDGEYDAVASSVSITKERQKQVNFTDPYFDVRQGVLVRMGTSFKSIDDLKNRALGVHAGTTSFLIAKQISASELGALKSVQRYGIDYFTAKKLPKGKVKAYNLTEHAVMALIQEDVDAVLFDEPVAVNYTRQEKYSGQLSVAFLITPPEPHHFGFAVKKGDMGTLVLLNEGLRKIRVSGEYDTIYRKWIGTLPSAN